MMAKMDFVQTVTIKRKGKAIIKFAENLELTYCRCQYKKYNITDVKGDFVITQISINFSDGSKWYNTYDKVKNEFRSSSTSRSATFYITANVVMKEMNLVTYELQGEITVSEKSGPTSTKILESPQAFAIDESRPESVVPTESSSNEITLLQKLHSNNRYSDVYFITSVGEKIPSHRCILAEISDSFVQIFDDASEIPVEINVEDFSADTIKSVLNFFHGISIAINVEVFKFAVKFGIQNLIDACLSFFEESVSLLNVCEYIQIAYLHNFGPLKQKCLELLVEKKKEIDPVKVNGLPKNILFDAFFF